MVVPLLFGAGLLVRSLTALSHVDAGYDPANVVTIRLSLPAAAYPSGSEIRGFWEEVLPRLEAVAGVQAVGLADGRPPAEASNWNNFDLHDDRTPLGQSQPVTPWLTVTPGFFDVLGVPLIRGRLLDERDRNDSVPAVVVDQAWARRFFPGEEVVGRRFWSGGCGSPGCPVNTIVGVVGNVKFAGLEDRGVGTVYDPNAGAPQRTTYLFVRTEGEPLGLLPDVRSVIRSVDPTLALSGIATATELLDAAVTEPRHVAIVVGLFALTALLVGGVGIYGVMSHFVRGRVKDIGVRVALGGAPADVFRLIVARGLLLAAIGGAVGAAGALSLSRLLSSMLFSVGTGDPGTLVAVIVLLFIVATVACTAPALRASHVDPMTVLRGE